MQTERKLTEAERAIILALAPNVGAYLDGALVVELSDGGMGSIRFVRSGSYRRCRSIAEAEYVDADGVLVSIEISLDENNELFELDFWKVDFSALQRYPRPED